MSGAEFILVGNLIQAGYTLLTLTKDVVKRVRHFSRDFNQVPKRFLDLQDCLALLGLILQRTKSRAASLSASDREIISHIVQSCESRVTKVTATFHKYHLADCSGFSFENLLKAIKSVSKDGEVEKLINEIEQNVSYISAHNTALAPTAEEISDVLTPELGSRIERSFSKAISKLMAASNTPGSPQSPHSQFEQANNAHKINAQTINYNYFNGVPGGHPGGHPAYAGPRQRLSTASLPTAFEGLSSPIHYNGPDPFQDQDITQNERVAQNRSRLSVDAAYHGSTNQQRGPRSSSRSSVRSGKSVHSYTSSASVFSTTGVTPAFSSPLTDSCDSNPLETSSEDQSDSDSPVDELKTANAFLEKAEHLIPTPPMPSHRIRSSTAEARTYFNQAMDKFSAVPTNDPVLALRRHRGLIYASLGLTKVTKSPQREELMERAAGHAQEARRAARRCSEAGRSAVGGTAAHARNAVCKVRLDLAAVRARQARLAEKRRATSDTVVEMRVEAFRLCLQVAEEMDGACATADDYDVHAQALLGCLEVAKTLDTSLSASGRAAQGVDKPLAYYDRAKLSIAAAIRLSTTRSDARDAIELTNARLDSSLAKRLV